MAGMALIVAHFNAVPSGRLWLFFHIAVVLGVLFIRGARAERIKPWLSILIVVINFSELTFLVHVVNPVDMDVWLIRADYRLTGLHPTVWLQRFTRPLLTEILQWIYAMFYFLPIILAMRLWRRDEMDRFAYFAFQIVLGFYISYVGYFLVPAVGPRFTLTDLHSLPLKGLWLRDSLDHWLTRLEGPQRDAFPSGHTMITLMTMAFARRLDKAYFRLVLPVGSLLIISTVYLRYHYVTDVLAGALWAVVSWWIGMRLFRYIYKTPA